MLDVSVGLLTHHNRSISGIIILYPVSGAITACIHFSVIRSVLFINFKVYYELIL